MKTPGGIAVWSGARYHLGMSSYLACDLGAESGRVMLGTLEGGRLNLNEIHRFPNVPIKDGNSMYWDIPKLFKGIREGLKKAAGKGEDITSLSCNSWGLDCVLLDRQGELIEPVYHYRDPRSAEGVKRVFNKISREEVFAETGIQFIPINALYHLAMETPDRLAATGQIITIGDAFNYFLCGIRRSEISMASTTQLYNPITKNWSAKVLASIGLTPDKFPELVPPGTRLAKLKPEFVTETGLGNVDVVATCTHDTGSAVAAVPATNGDSDWAYLSSGTWSLMGVEINEPLITEQCRELNFTNEIGYGNTVRLLKNIIGLWLVQECKRHWAAAGEDYDYAQLTQMAVEAEPFRSLMNPDDERFMAASSMPAAIAGFCRDTDQPAPESPGQFVRCCLESLALFYRLTMQRVSSLSGKPVNRLHIVGGGSQNGLLNQFTANACNVTVIAGPTEATALGNILVQAITAGEIESLATGRQIIANSFKVDTFTPSDQKEWSVANERFLTLIRE